LETVEIETTEQHTLKPFIDPRILEALAEFEHVQWMEWAKALLLSEPGISQARKDRWAGLLVPYAELSEASKEQDREWARGVGKIVMTAILTGLYQLPETPDTPETPLTGAQP